MNALIFVVFSGKLLEVYGNVCCWYCRRRKEPTYLTFGGADAARNRVRQHPRRIEETNRVLIPPGGRGGSGGSSPRSYRSNVSYGSVGQRNRLSFLGSGENVATPVPSDADKH